MYFHLRCATRFDMPPTAVFAMTNTFPPGTRPKIDGGEPWD